MPCSGPMPARDAPPCSAPARRPCGPKCPARRRPERGLLSGAHSIRGLPRARPPEEPDRRRRPARLRQHEGHGPDSGNRGKLSPASASELYARCSPRSSVVRRPRGVLGQDRGVRALAPLGLPLSHGHAFPSVEDGFDYAGTARSGRRASTRLHSVSLIEAPVERACARRGPQGRHQRVRFATSSNPLPLAAPRRPADVYVGAELRGPRAFAPSPPGKGRDRPRRRGSLKLAATLASPSAPAASWRTASLEHEIRWKQPTTFRGRWNSRSGSGCPQPGRETSRFQVESARGEAELEEFVQETGPIPGSRRWRVKLEPGAKRVLKAKYTLRIQSKKELAGGNRREA